MSKIRLHGSSSGYTEIAPVAASGNNTITLPNDGTLISHDGNGAVGVTSITVGTGVTIGDGRVTCTTVHGAASGLTGALPALNAASLTNVPAANIVGVVTTGFSGSIIEIDCWNFTANFTQPGSHGQYITANWQRKPTHFTKKGTGMSESSGVFTFPKTGLYLIRVHLSVNTLSGNLAYCGPYIQISTNSGGSYDRVSEGYTAIDHGTRYSNASSEAIVNVTSVSLFKCRLETEASDSFNVRASNGQSVIDFIRLGDST